MLRSWLSCWAPALIVLAAGSLVGAGVVSPLGAVVAALIVLVLLSVGVFFPQTRMYAPWHSRLGGGDAVALTFDDGPHPASTRQVLDLLDAHGARATFFVIGRKVEAYPDVVREIVERGHALGIHGFAHDRLHAFKTPERVVADIRRTQRAVYEAAGVTPTLFRPPLGFVSPFTAAGARRAGVTLVGWSLRGLDGLARRRPEQVLRRIARGLRGGDVVLLHDAAEHDGFTPAGIAVLPEILTLLRSRKLHTAPLASCTFASQGGKVRAEHVPVELVP